VPALSLIARLYASGNLSTTVAHLGIWLPVSLGAAAVASSLCDGPADDAGYDGLPASGLLAARLVSAPGTFQPCCGSLCAAPPHRTDCCRPIRRRGGVKGAFEYTLTRHFPPYSLTCGQSQPLTPYRRSIAIRRQSGGGPLHFPGHAAVARPSPSNIKTRASAGEQRRWLDHPPSWPTRRVAGASRCIRRAPGMLPNRRKRTIWYK